MITLQELWDYYEKGYLYLRIDAHFPSESGINFPCGLPDEIAEKLIKEERITIRSSDGLEKQSFDLIDGHVTVERGLLHSSIEIKLPPDAKIILPNNLSTSRAKKFAKGEKIVIENGDKTKTYFFALNELNLGVSVETAHAKRNIWENIKNQLKEAGFSYRSESPWFRSYRKGRWTGIFDFD